MREPVDRGVWVAPSYALDECADGVVVAIAGAVVDDGLLLDGVLGDFAGDGDGHPGIALAQPRRFHCDFEGRQRAAGIAVALGRPDFEGFIGECDVERAVAVGGVRCGPPQDRLDRVLAE